MKRILFALTVLVLFVGCEPEPQKFPRVERVMMHDPLKYSLFVRDGGGGIKSITLDNLFGGVVFHDDVEQGASMWAEVVKEGDHTVLHVHVHTIKEVNGAGWNHGKGGRGQTVPIE